VASIFAKLGEKEEKTSTNYAEAAKWFLRAAEQDNPQHPEYQGYAQGNLADYYGFGYGVPNNNAECNKWRQRAGDAKWHRRAAEQGDANAQDKLGDAYRYGLGVPKDFAKASKWYQLSAEQGKTGGQWSLGFCYRDGIGVPQDPVEAYKWFNLDFAQASGDETDPTSARWLLKFQIASLSREMTPQQIALAQRLSTQFVAKQNDAKVPTGRDDASGLPSASGSGFFISDDGKLLTNFHVVDGASRIVVKTTQGSFSAKVVRLDAANDIAILTVVGSTFHSLPLAPSRTVKLGESVFTIGFPSPRLQGVEPKLTDGRISSLAGAQDDVRYFQISVPVQPGNSGGALVNSVGNVVGIVSARLSDKAGLEASGAIPQNVNYAIKSSYVLSLLESVQDATGKLKEPWPAGERKYEDVVKEVREAAALVLVY